ncbi:HMA domain protein [Natronomonas pharaonis DSM 2160]|uniref:HMA domain protein n=1 Tax=Natronomonas pharaonis (strain ATCC 35678 / DSM 2160 / CIP 103997 / JCM 8858 / NBRC 14720 / NCIMB 2260 / Gabara) TaxID=348780 RepID=A0A1U7EWE9_NATPD|nr:heavy-metal-associated domain-containing protein [Natronomonas pharaonis]CAI49424.1 HMA domain protein [Natronomonas pharaonis DSM 2160]
MATTLSVPDMACGGCETEIEESLGELDGVDAVDADHEDGTVTVEGGADWNVLAEAVSEAGYSVD